MQHRLHTTDASSTHTHTASAYTLLKTSCTHTHPHNANKTQTQCTCRVNHLFIASDTSVDHCMHAEQSLLTKQSFIGKAQYAIICSVLGDQVDFAWFCCHLLGVSFGQGTVAVTFECKVMHRLPLVVAVFAGAQQVLQHAKVAFSSNGSLPIANKFKSVDKLHIARDTHTVPIKPPLNMLPEHAGQRQCGTCTRIRSHPGFAKPL